MIFTNTSIYPSSQVRTLVDFALKAIGIDPESRNNPITKIRVQNCSAPHRGLCNDSSILLRIGSPHWFTRPVYCHYRKTAPAYTMEDWKEGLVTLAAHEGTHAIHFAANRGVDEVTCENNAYKALCALREQRPTLDRLLLAPVAAKHSKALSEQLLQPSKITPSDQILIRAWFARKGLKKSPEQIDIHEQDGV